MRRPLRILVVAFAARARAELTALTREDGHAVVEAVSFDEARALLDRRPRGAFDVMLIDEPADPAAPRGFLRGLRRGGDETPAILVSPTVDVSDRVRSLTEGADDILLRPFDPTELLARMHAVVRRDRALPNLVRGALVVSRATRRVEHDGEAIDLTSTEFDLLVALLDARGEIVSRETLLQRVWDVDFDPGTTLVQVRIGQLRRKLERVGLSIIRTVRGEGYVIDEFASEERPQA